MLVNDTFEMKFCVFYESISVTSIWIYFPNCQCDASVSNSLTYIYMLYRLVVSTVDSVASAFRWADGDIFNPVHLKERTKVGIHSYIFKTCV